MTRVGRAVEKGETQGFMKILVDAEAKEILGASLLPRRRMRRGDSFNSRCDVRQSAFTAIQRAVHIHPTVSELIPTMFGGLKPLEADNGEPAA